MRLLFGVILAGAVAVSCGEARPALDPAEAVNIRVVNVSQRDIYRAWLGHSGDFSRRIEFTETVGGFPATPYIAVGAEPPNYSVLDTTFLETGRATTWLKEAIVATGAPQPEGAVHGHLVAGRYYTIEIDFREPPESFTDGIPTIIDDGQGESN